MKTTHQLSFLQTIALMLACIAWIHPVLHAASFPNAWQITDDSSTFGAFVNYTHDLAPAQVSSAIEHGWRYSMTCRLVDDFGADPAMFMLFGDGSRRFGISWDFDIQGNLVVTPSGGALPVVVQDTGGADQYHLHELIGLDGQASYFVDGSFIATVEADLIPNNANEVLFGALSSLGRGRMNFHQVEFWVEGHGLVAAYRAGFENAPAIAPSPTDQGWIRNSSNGLETDQPISPDTVSLGCRTLVFVDPSWAGTTFGADPDGTGPATAFGVDAFAFYVDAQTAVCPDGTIQVNGEEIRVTSLDITDPGRHRVEFEDIVGLGSASDCVYTLETIDHLGPQAEWRFIPTLELNDLENGRREFIVSNPDQTEGYYRVVAWVAGDADADSDGLSDSLESRLGTDPNDPDSDGDGIGDCTELSHHSDPLDPESHPLVISFPRVEFLSNETVVVESGSTITIPVVFDRAYRGTLYYEIGVGGSADSSDFDDLLGGSVSVNGTTVDLQFRLADDLDLEPVETVAISLLRNATEPYRRGVQLSHALVIVDNDVKWVGTFIAPGMLSRFNLQVLRSGNQSTGWLMPAKTAGHSRGTIPNPPDGQPGWSFASWTQTETSLQAVSVPMPAPGSRLFGQQSLQRVIEFTAIPPSSSSDTPYFVQNSNVHGVDIGPVFIGGSYTDTLAPVRGAGGRFGGLEGVFTLVRELPVAPALSIPFVNP